MYTKNATIQSALKPDIDKIICYLTLCHVLRHLLENISNKSTLSYWEPLLYKQEIAHPQK